MTYVRFPNTSGVSISLAHGMGPGTYLQLCDSAREAKFTLAIERALGAASDDASAPATIVLKAFDAAHDRLHCINLGVFEPPSAMSATFDVSWVKVAVSLNGQERVSLPLEALGLNGGDVWGLEFLNHNVAAGAISISTGNEHAIAKAFTGACQANPAHDIALIHVTDDMSASPPELAQHFPSIARVSRAEFEGMFKSKASHISKIQDSTHIAVLFGDPTPEFYLGVNRYLADNAPSRLFTSDPEFLFEDFRWGFFVAPRQYRQNPTLTVIEGSIVLDEHFKSTAYWITHSGHGDHLTKVRAHSARLPSLVSETDDPALLGSLFPVPQLLLHCDSAAPEFSAIGSSTILPASPNIETFANFRSELARVFWDISSSATSHIIFCKEPQGYKAVLQHAHSLPVCTFTQSGALSAVLMSREAFKDILRLSARFADTLKDMTSGSMLEWLQGVLSYIAKHAGFVTYSAELTENWVTAAEAHVEDLTPHWLGHVSAPNAMARLSNTSQDSEARSQAILQTALGLGQISTGLEFAIQQDQEQPEAKAVQHFTALIRAKMGRDLDSSNRPDLLRSLWTLLSLGRQDDVQQIAALITAHIPPLDGSRDDIDLSTVMLSAVTYQTADTCPAFEAWQASGHSTPSDAAWLDAATQYLANRKRWQDLLDLQTRIDPLFGPPWETRTRFFFADIMVNGSGARKHLEAEPRHFNPWAYSRLKMRFFDQARMTTELQQSTLDVLEQENKTVLLQTPKFLAAPNITVDQADVVCIMVVRNERLRLPYLVSYYQSIGVTQFIIIDNGSVDGTVDWLQSKDNVMWLATEDSYAASVYGVQWHNYIAETYAKNAWVLTVDADEMLVYDGFDDGRLISDLCADMQRDGYQGLFAPMIDMYSDLPLSQVRYDSGDPLLETFGYFDASGYFVDLVPGFPSRAVYGGVRRRIFQRGSGGADMLKNIALHKVPLVFWQPGFKYLASTHDMTPLKISTEVGALLHFKFLPDFHQRAEEEVRRKEHFEGGNEYRIYADMISKRGDVTFLGDCSRKFESFRSISDLCPIRPYHEA